MVVPSLKVSGGVREALRLAADLQRGASATCVLSMWASPHPMDAAVPVEKLSNWKPRVSRAAFELPALLFRFARWLRDQEHRPAALIFTHYATLPLALLVPKRQRFFFVQDLEWQFIGNSFLSSLLRRVVLGFYRGGKIISANAYLTERLAKEGLEVFLEAPIWADPSFAGRAVAHRDRDVDLVMVLRKGAHKRLDLYRRFIALARQRGLRTVAITPEDEIAELVRAEIGELVLRPSGEQMKAIYGRSKCFVHLSEHEGFGLPPLEAMGSGCVPVCRDSGGVRVFMRDAELAKNLLPLGTPIEGVLDRAVTVIGNGPAWEGMSAVARSCFDIGLREGFDARARLAATLAQRGGR